MRAALTGALVGLALAVIAAGVLLWVSMTTGGSPDVPAGTPSASTPGAVPGGAHPGAGVVVVTAPPSASVPAARVGGVISVDGAGVGGLVPPALLDDARWAPTRPGAVRCGWLTGPDLVLVGAAEAVEPSPAGG